MTRLFHVLRNLIAEPSADRPRARVRLGSESLDDRIVPTVSAISSGFNGTSLAAGDTVWFSAVMKVSGLGSTPVTIRTQGGTITSPQFTLAVPDAAVTFSPTATTATTSFDAGANAWVTTVPSSGLSGNVFLAGVSLPLPAGLRGGVKPVTWQADFKTDSPGVSLSWKWAAAAYTQFATDYTAVGVKPVDDNRASQYQNSHHAGTPEAFTPFVVGGARGGGGSNFTGSYSGTKSLTPDLFSPPPPPPAGPSSLAGYVYWDFDRSGTRNGGDLGIEGAEVRLTGTDDQGNAVALTALTGADGYYQFAGLRPGTYTLTETQPTDFLDGAESVGTIAGVPTGTLGANDVITAITLGAGQDGVNYNFGEVTEGGPA